MTQTGKLAAATLALLVLLTACAFEPPAAEPSIRIGYPIEHYRITEDGLDFVAWRREVIAFRADLRIPYPFEDVQPSLTSKSREVEFLDRAVDPAMIIWRDPAAFWRDHVTMSWFELIDEKGEVVQVFVTTSNQSKEADSRIIAWCLEGKTWSPAIVDGQPVASLRTASINLGESRLHIGYWQKVISTDFAIVVVLLTIILGVPFAAIRVRRWRASPDVS